ncbi:hypothetical protein, partial [Burkholderia pseudomallei]
SENARLTMVWPSRRHVTFFSNRPRALNHYIVDLGYKGQTVWVFQVEEEFNGLLTSTHSHWFAPDDSRQ